jgi:hypothetical protein
MATVLPDLEVPDRVRDLGLRNQQLRQLCSQTAGRYKIQSRWQVNVKSKDEDVWVTGE